MCHLVTIPRPIVPIAGTTAVAKSVQMLNMMGGAKKTPGFKPLNRGQAQFPGQQTQNRFISKLDKDGDGTIDTTELKSLTSLGLICFKDF